MLKLKLQYFGHLMWRADSLEKLWCWEGLGAGGKGDDRGWDGWMASLTRWMWVWVNSGRWWWTGRPGMLRFTGSQRVGHDWATELNWTEQALLRKGTASLLEQKRAEVRVWATGCTEGGHLPVTAGGGRVFVRQSSDCQYPYFNACWNGRGYRFYCDVFLQNRQNRTFLSCWAILWLERTGFPWYYYFVYTH